MKASGRILRGPGALSRLSCKGFRFARLKAFATLLMMPASPPAAFIKLITFETASTAMNAPAAIAALQGVWTFISQLAATLFGSTEDNIDGSTQSTKDKLLEVWGR